MLSNMRSAFVAVIESRYFLISCFGLFIILRGLLVLVLPLEMQSDAHVFLTRGLGIADGKGYVASGQPTAYWPVGYPGFLGVVFYLFGKDQLSRSAGQSSIVKCIVFSFVRTGSEHISKREYCAYRCPVVRDLSK